jgi:sugar phosphate permease
VLAAGTAAQTTFSAVGIGLPVLAPALRDAYGLSLPEIGVVLAAEWIGLVVFQLPWGFAADRFGERLTVPLGLAGCAIALAGAAVTGSFAWLIAMLALAGAAGGSVQTGSGRAVMHWFGTDERGFALGVRQTAVPLGGVVAAFALPALGSARAGLLFLAGFVLVGAVVAAAALRERPGDGADTVDVEWTLRDSRLWKLCAGSGLYVVAQLALVGFLVLFLNDERGLSPGEAGAALAAMQALAIVLRIAAGRWSDLLRSRVEPMRRIGLAVFATLALTAALVEAPLVVLVPTMVLAGGLSMAWNGLSFAAAAELAGARRSGAAIGVQQTALAVVGIGGPIAFAALVEATSWQAGFGLAALFPLAGWLVLRGL